MFTNKMCPIYNNTECVQSYTCCVNFDVTTDHCYNCTRSTLPSAKTITRKISEHYEQEFVVYKKLLKNKQICLTMDIWTDSLNNKSFIGITCHFLCSEKQKIKQITLGIVHLTATHTARNIADKISEVLEKWNIDVADIVIIVTDNAANINAAVTILVGNRRHLGCFAHLLNLVAENSIFNENLHLSGIISKVKDLVAFFKRSNKAAQKLRESQQCSIPLKLIQCVSTRWNSIYDMLQRFYDLRVCIGQVLIAEGKEFLNIGELEVICSILPVLKLLKDVTVEFSGSFYVTGSGIIPAINCFIYALNSVELRNTIAAKLKQNILINIEKRFGALEENQNLAIATLLDPRFKKLHFKQPFALSNALKTIDNDLTRSCETESQSLDEDVQVQTTSTPTPGLWSHHLRLVQDCSITNTMSAYTQELSSYINSPCTDIKSDPLGFWFTNKSNFPRLYEMALKFLLIPATSVPAERLFSMAGNIITEKRNRISEKHLEETLILNSIFRTNM